MPFHFTVKRLSIAFSTFFIVTLDYFYVTSCRHAPSCLFVNYSVYLSKELTYFQSFQMSIYSTLNVLTSFHGIFNVIVWRPQCVTTDIFLWSLSVRTHHPIRLFINIVLWNVFLVISNAFYLTLKRVCCHITFVSLLVSSRTILNIFLLTLAFIIERKAFLIHIKIS